MGQTLIEKIANQYATGLQPGQKVHALDYITFRPKHVMTHDNTAAVMKKFQMIGVEKIADPTQPVWPMDHDIQNKSKDNLAKYSRIEEFAREQGVCYFPPCTGIGHQLMMDEGFVLPGTMCVASDSHSNTYGALSALGTPVVRTDAAAIWATGQTWWEIPEIVRVELTGTLQSGVVGKDVIITLCGLYNNDEVLNRVIEFSGEGIRNLSIDQRMCIANMTTEWGALAGVFPFDSVLRDWFYHRADLLAGKSQGKPPYTRGEVDLWYANRLEADPDAYYSKTLELDLSAVTPHVAGPDNVKTITPVSDIEKQEIRIDKAYLLSCTNGRFEDIQEAAEILKGRHVAGHVTLYLAAASAEIEEQAKDSGHWQVLLDAGAVVLPPGCGPCIGLGEGTLNDGEIGISATNRNFKGRMGSRDAKVYLGSPAVVASSAVAGYISGSSGIHFRPMNPKLTVHPQKSSDGQSISIMDGFPESYEGRLLFLPQNNINTDGIYGKEYTYREDLSPDEMGQAALMNYDPTFQNLVQEGDILVSGSNFGCGSSREQAATALACRGIRMVIAESFSQTYKRNAFNNGFIVFECMELVQFLRSKYEGSIDRGSLTIPMEDTARVDFASGTIHYAGQEYKFPALGKVPQELIVAGGSEAVIRKQLADK